MPARLQEPLSATANDLVYRIQCVPPRPQATPAPPAEDNGHGHGKGHEKHHGKGKEKGRHGHDGGDD